MKNTKLAAGQHGLDNQIKWVTIVEVLEDIQRLQKGEFLITTGFKLLEDEDRMDVFHDLLKSNFLSGVAIYTSFYMEKIPQSFIELADAGDLPIIEIPTDINFSEITKAILEQIVNNQMYLLEQSEKIHRELTDLILNDQSLQEVTERLGQLTASETVIFNAHHDIIHANDVQQNNVVISSSRITINQHESDLTYYLNLSVKTETKTSFALDNYVITIHPILAKRTSFGWIVMIKPKAAWQKLDDIAMERATSIYAMEFLKQAAIEETRLRIQSNFLDDIFHKNYGNENIIKERARKLNYDLSVNQTVFHVTCKQAEKMNTKIMDRLYYITEQMLTQKNKQHIIQRKFHSLIFLTNVAGETKKDKYRHCISLAEEMHKEWKYHFPEVDMIVGIGKDYNQIELLGKSANEAQYAIELSDLISPASQVVHYGDLGMYDLLLEMKRNGIHLQSMYESSMNGLLRQSAKEIDLIETMEMYFKNNQSIRQTAEELFIHRHTLRYRLNQIEAKTGLNLKSADDRLKLELSVMAYKLDEILT